ncbi:MAG: tetratricopeptide repeat protein [Acidobacteriota bacterium]
MTRKSHSSTSTGIRLPWKSCGAVALLAALLYLPTVRYDFTFDDSVIVARNPAVQAWGRWREVLLSDYWPEASSALYRSVTILSFAVERPLHGTGPAGFHAVNVILHSAVSALACLLAASILGSGWAAIFVGAAFAAHPIHTEAVSGVVGRTELLSSFFAMLALWMWLRRSGRSGGTGLQLPAYLLFFLGLGSKENVVILPLLVLLWESARRGPRTAGKSLLRSPHFLAFLVPVLLFLGLRTAVLGGISSAWNPDPPFVENPLAHEPAPARVLLALSNQGRAVLLHLFPHPLIADYSYRTLPGIPALIPLLGMAALAAAGIGLWFVRSERMRAAALGISWYAVAMLPASNIVFPIGTVFAERLYYLPSFGLLLAIGAVLLWAQERLRLQLRWGRSTAVLLVALLTTVTWVRNPAWSSDLALFTDTVAKAPENAKARLWLADSLVRTGRHRESLQHYEKAMEIYPQYAAPAMNVVVPLNELGRYREAIDAGRRARGLLHGDNPVLLYNLGLAHLKLGDSVGFLEAMNRAIALDPMHGPAHAQLGRYYMQQTPDYQRAREHLEQAARLATDESEAEAIRRLLQRLGRNP